MRFASRLWDLPLRVQLMLAFALLSIITTAIATITLTHLSDRRLRANLHERSEQVARHLQQELQPVITYDDHLTARELFAAYAGEQDLDGMGVYAPNGELIEGRGNRPESLSSIDADIRRPDESFDSACGSQIA